MTDFKSVSGIKQKFLGLVKYKLSLMMEEISVFCENEGCIKKRCGPFNVQKRKMF